MNTRTPADIFTSALERLSRTNLFEPEGEPIRLGGTMLEACNDDEPAYIRTPELDQRMSLGDIADSNAWYESATGRTRYFCVGFNPLDGKWLPVVERSEVTR